MGRVAADPALVNEKIMAIDFGASGGFVWNEDNALQLVEMPTAYDDINRLISSVQPKCVVGENVHSFPGQGGVSIETFLRGVGRIEGILCAWGIKLYLIEPSTWVKWYGIGKSGDFKTSSGKTDKPAWKKHLQSEAIRLFPHLQINLKVADAVLIWNYWNNPDRIRALRPFDAR